MLTLICIGRHQVKQDIIKQITQWSCLFHGHELLYHVFLTSIINTTISLPPCTPIYIASTSTIITVHIWLQVHLKQVQFNSHNPCRNRAILSKFPYCEQWQKVCTLFVCEISDKINTTCKSTHPVPPQCLPRGAQPRWLLCIHRRTFNPYFVSIETIPPLLFLWLWPHWLSRPFQPLPIDNEYYSLHKDHASLLFK